MTKITLRRDVDAIRKAGVTRINARAGRVREMFITEAPGQSMIYLNKESEGLRWLATESPDLIDFPFIQAEIGITADTAEELATMWVTSAAQWRQIGAMIETARLSAVAAAEQADSKAEIASIMGALEQSLQTIIMLAG